MGSPRVTTDQTGAVVSRRNFRPYGEEIYRPNQGTDKIRQKFTGYERDNETNLDFTQARMYGCSLGRFTSPDPLSASANPIRPQSWNRYSYSFNNPLRFTDPSGMIVGDYYNQKGEYLGWDGVKDENIYVVTNGKQEGLIKKNEKNGGSIALSEISSAVKLPSLKVREATGEAVERTKKPTTDDLLGNRHEEGFVAGLVDGKEEIAVAPSGKFSNIADPKTEVASVDTLANAGNYNFSELTVQVHTHPGGEFVPSMLNTQSSSVGTTIGGNQPSSRFFANSPADSPTDFKSAGQLQASFPNMTFVTAAVGNNTAYIYNSSTVRATFPLDKFTSVTARKR